MRSALIFVLCIFGSQAAAHPGHLGELAGHDHWVAGAAIGLAILLGLREALKGRKDKSEEVEDEAEVEEVPA